MSSKMIRETYTENLPYVEGFIISLSKSRGKHNIYDLYLDPELVELELASRIRGRFERLNGWLVKKSLTTPIYLSADIRDYGVRHALAEKLERIRDKILEEERDAARRARENRRKCNI